MDEMDMMNNLSTTPMRNNHSLVSSSRLTTQNPAPIERRERTIAPRDLLLGRQPNTSQMQRARVSLQRSRRNIRSDRNREQLRERTSREAMDEIFFIPPFERIRSFNSMNERFIPGFGCIGHKRIVTSRADAQKAKNSALSRHKKFFDNKAIKEVFKLKDMETRICAKVLKRKVSPFQ